MSREILIELEDYDLKEVIGGGNFRAVFRAIEKKTGKEVALKVIPLIFKTKIEQANFLRTISAPRLHGLPGIVKLIGFRFPLTKEDRDELAKKDPTKLKFSTIEQGKKLEFDLTGAIIVTKFMKNGSLDEIVYDYLRNDGKVTDKINPTIRSKIIFGIAATMKRAHKKNIYHRDLKIENIYLDDKMEPRIANFGLAKAIFDNTYNAIHTGVPDIIDPSILIDEESYSKKIDIFLFAILVHRMFTNTIEFEDKKPIRSHQQFMMRIHRGDKLKRSNSISDPYWELIQKCYKNDQADPMTFEIITEKLKNDIFAINEFGMKTDLDQLHEYQERIDEDKKLVLIENIS